MWKLILKFAVSAALIWIIFSKIDTEALGAQLARLEVLPVILAALVLWATSLIAAWRWRAVIANMLPAGSQPPGFVRVWRLLWIGLFFNQTLPSAAGGDAMRMWLVRRSGLSNAAAINSVLIDRISALVGVILLVAISFPLIAGRINDDAGIAAIWILLAGCTAAVVVAMVLDRVPLPRRLLEFRIAQGIRQLSTDLRGAMTGRTIAVPIIAASVVIQIMVAAMVYGLGVSLGMPIQLLDCIALVPIIILITMVPISIAGWGVREGAMVAGFGYVGLSPVSALSLSLLFGFINLAISLPGGILWLLQRERAAREPASGKPGSQP
ncbi:MAG: lysylphosphatidylglycerol synthase transmembrane domain-containing protein [Alphaproteobacteria bacterium]